MAAKKQKPKKCISKKEAKELHDNWCNQREGHLKKRLGFEDTREFWWSVEELEEYLAYVKSESNKQGIDHPGIRIYMGAYSKAKCKMKRGYSTLFMVPTGAPAKSLGKENAEQPNNYDIDAYNRGGSGRPPHIY
ncbi:hypothetical protein GCM10022393_27140 [Aquimarina addita]|uniref:Uncharacterized protein n=1 Tax=Aquimarina addita TaxID=870485 RepID=A0ABP6UM38_9FLAO